MSGDKREQFWANQGECKNSKSIQHLVKAELKTESEDMLVNIV